MGGLGGVTPPRKTWVLTNLIKEEKNFSLHLEGTQRSANQVDFILPETWKRSTSACRTVREISDKSMKERVKRFWQVLNSEITATGAIEGTAKVSGTALGLAAAFGLASPIAAAACSPILLITEAVKFYKKNSQGAPLEEFVAAIAPLAYLSSFNALAHKNIRLAQFTQSNTASEPQSVPDELIFDLDRELAIDALSFFHHSKLAGAFNQVLSKQLQQDGLNDAETQIVTAWVAWGAGSFLRDAIAQAGDSIDRDSHRIAKLYSAAPDNELSSYSSIEAYLDKIAGYPQDKVFDEDFSFQDIYVPLEAKSVYKNGKVRKYSNSFVLEDWAKQVLQDPQKQQQVMFVQGGPGRGKSVFCKMFADWVRQNLHPLWTPILICLRDITLFDRPLEEILKDAVPNSFSKSEDWLTDKNKRFLFLLDGFDELRMEGRAGGGIKRFINQVGEYQKSCQSPELGHRFIVTGRQPTLRGIDYLAPNPERVELIEMDDGLQQQWLKKWQQAIALDVEKFDAKEAAREAQDFQNFLQADRCPTTVREELAREPLLLYLLAAMHRDGELKVEALEGTSGIEAKIKIYEQSLHWVLNKQREPIQKEVVCLKPEELEWVLMEAELCVVQSGGEYAKFSTIEERLKLSEPEIAEAMRDIRENKGDEVLKNALAAFYLKPAAGDAGGSVEFFHKSFSEFLCAKRLQQELEDWTIPGRRNKKYDLNDDRFAHSVYDLLGYGGLTPEIVEYLMGLLAQSENFRPVQLFERLKGFYLDWCENEFISAPPNENHPQWKMQALAEQAPDTQEKRLGLPQVDVYAGLNVMILLLELHRYGHVREEFKEQIAFYPCGKPKEGKLEDSTRLYRLMGYSRCLGNSGFRDTVGSFLQDAYLTGANLTGAFLNRANLTGAFLNRAFLNRAFLTSAAYLTGANLTGAFLEDAILDGANLTGANLKNISWNEKTNWNRVRGLDKALNVPEALKQQLKI